MNLLRLAVLFTALPGRLLIRHLDRQRAHNKLQPMGRFLRGSTHGFLWVIALMVVSMATAPIP